MLTVSEWDPAVVAVGECKLPRSSRSKQATLKQTLSLLTCDLQNSLAAALYCFSFMRQVLGT